MHSSGSICTDPGGLQTAKREHAVEMGVISPSL